MLKRHTLAFTFLLLLPISLRAADKPADTIPAKENEGLPLAFHEDFKEPEKAFARFEFLDPADWKMAKDGNQSVLSLAKKPSAKTEVRSPFGRAIIKDLYVGPFVMEVKLKSTVKDYNHRDMCLFFGENSISHLYYVHLGKKPDANCGNIYLVNAADRKNLLPPQEKGIDWTENYHVARLTRNAGGDIEIFFDGKSWLKVNDKTLPVGRVGVGSFDDTGDFSEITVWGQKLDKPLLSLKGLEKKPAKPADKK